MLPEAPTWDHDIRPSSVLARLHSILTAFRDGGNNALVEILYQKMAHAQSLSSAAVPRPLRRANSGQKPRAVNHAVAGASSSEWEPWDSRNSQRSRDTGTVGNVPPEPSLEAAFANEDSLGESPIASHGDSALSGPLVTQILPQRDFEGLWTYGQTSYTANDYAMPHQFNASADLTAPLLDQISVDMVLNNLIFDSGNQISLEAYWPDNNTPDINSHSQQT